MVGYDGCLFDYYIYEHHDVDYYRKEHSNNFHYDEDGRLVLIREEPTTEDFDWQHWEGLYDYTGLIEINYQDNGSPLIVEHLFFSHTHGTSDSSGYAIYDSEGRMVFRYHYVTSGGHSYSWFYEGDSRRPWACVEWGGMYYSGVNELSYYTELADTPDWVLECAAKGFLFSYGCETTVRIFKDF